MDLSFIKPASQPSYPSQSPMPLSRKEKTSDFVSNVLPSAVFTGLQGLSAQAAPATGVAASGASAASTAAGAASAVGMTTGIIGGLWGGYQLIQNWGKSSPSAGAASGAALGGTIGTMICPGIGTLIGAGIGAIAGGLIGGITAGKHKDQKVRDAVRQQLVNLGVLSPDYKLQLADGTLCDMGKDGGPRAEFGGRRPFEIDTANPLTQYAVGWMDPIIAVLAPGNTKIRNDFAGYFANAALSNARDVRDVKRNVDLFMSKFGLTNESLAQGVISLAEQGYISKEIAQGWISGIQQRMDPRLQGDAVPSAALAPENGLQRSE